MHTPEDIDIHIFIVLFHLGNQPLHLPPGALLLMRGGTLGKAAGALQKAQVIVLPPADDVLLPHQVQRSDQLHPREVGAAQLGQHRLDLRPVQHTHQRGFYHIVKMVPQRDLVAAQRLRFLVQVATAHPRAKVAGGTARRLLHHAEDRAFENMDGQLQRSGILLDQRAVGRAVPRVHHQVLHLKGEIAVPLQMLHTLGQQHTVLAPADADGNTVPRPDQLIILAAPDKPVPDGLAVFGDQAALGQRARGQFFWHCFAPRLPCPLAAQMIPHRRLWRKRLSVAAFAPSLFTFLPAAGLPRRAPLLRSGTAGLRPAAAAKPRPLRGAFPLPIPLRPAAAPPPPR